MEISSAVPWRLPAKWDALDPGMERVVAAPSFRAVAPLAGEDLQRLFGTDRPTHDLVANSDELFEALERGQGVYIIVYKGDQPVELIGSNRTDTRI